MEDMRELREMREEVAALLDATEVLYLAARDLIDRRVEVEAHASRLDQRDRTLGVLIAATVPVLTTRCEVRRRMGDLGFML